MGLPAARVTDPHVCPMFSGLVPHVGGPIIPPCAVTVLTGGLFQARLGDMLVCVGPPDVIVKGSPTVIVMGSLAARMTDNTAHGGMIVMGFPTVLIGESGGGSGGSSSSSTTKTSMGQSYATTMQIPEGATIAPAQQAGVYKNAAKTGTPFCERCTA